MIFFVVGLMLKGIFVFCSELRMMDICLPLKEAPAVPERLSEKPHGTAIRAIAVKASRLSARIQQHLRSGDFLGQAQKRPQAFTRRRKVGLVGVVSIILNMVRKTTQVELDDYLERIHPEGGAVTYTKQSFAEARQNLRPEALTGLNDVLIQGYYADGDYVRYRGFRLLAIDGSVMEVPNTPALRAYYGAAENQSEQGTVARARSSSLYDVLNGLTVHAILGHYDRAERDMAKEHLLALERLTLSDTPTLVLFDRGYPSADLILWLVAHHIRFVMRVSQGFYSEIYNTTETDAVVTIRITPDRARRLKEKGTPVPVGTGIRLRVLNVTLPTGDQEILITDLTPGELPYAEALPLYFQRWGVETHYDDVKNKWEIENFSGRTPVVIEQDFAATIFLSNLAAIVEEDAQAEADERRRQSPRTYKYQEYRINRNVLVGTMKNRLIQALLEPDGQHRDQAFQRIVRRVQRALIPVRRGRAAPRHKGKKANKYSQNRRRPL